MMFDEYVWYGVFLAYMCVACRLYVNPRHWVIQLIIQVVFSAWCMRTRQARLVILLIQLSWVNMYMRVTASDVDGQYHITEIYCFLLLNVNMEIFGMINIWYI